MNLLASLRYLVALHEHRHFGRAAQACHITQPALSNAQRMLRESEVLRQELSSLQDMPRGCLRMASTPTAVPVLARFAALLQARHPGIASVVLSMSSLELEQGLEDLSIDLAVGYSERMQAQRANLRSWPQCTERYYLLRRSAEPSPGRLRIGTPMAWREAGQLPLCLLTTEMHNRFIIDQALREAGAPVVPAIETNSVLTLVLSVAAGQVCSILPSAMVAAVRSERGERGLEALPLVGPDVRTPIGFMTQRGPRTSRALEAALALLESPEWQTQLSAHCGDLAD